MTTAIIPSTEALTASMNIKKDADGKVIAFTIIRDRWARAGAGKGISWMLNSEGNMCCLGFYGKACGSSDTSLRAAPTPSSVIDEHVEPWLLLGGGLSSDAGALAGINDSHEANDEKREALIVKVFAQHGVEVTFVDKVPVQGPSELEDAHVFTSLEEANKERDYWLNHENQSVREKVAPRVVPAPPPAPPAPPKYVIKSSVDYYFSESGFNTTRQSKAKVFKSNKEASKAARCYRHLYPTCKIGIRRLVPAKAKGVST